MIKRFNQTLAQQLAIVTSKHQRDRDTYVPLVLMAHRSAAQEDSPAVLMLGRQIRTPAEMVVVRSPDTSLEAPGLEYGRKLQDHLNSAHEFARNQTRGLLQQDKGAIIMCEPDPSVFRQGTWSGSTTRIGKSAGALSWTKKGWGPAGFWRDSGFVCCRGVEKWPRTGVAPYKGSAAPGEPTCA